MEELKAELEIKHLLLDHDKLNLEYEIGKRSIPA